MSSPLCLLGLDWKRGGSPASSSAWIVQYSCGTNARISCSRSTISRSAKVCTRLGDRPRRLLPHSSGETLYPTMRSSTRRACCASTRLVSTCRGFSNAARIAFGVMSLNVTRKIFFGSIGGMLISSRFFLALLDLPLASPLEFLDSASSFASAAPLPLFPLGASSSAYFVGLDSTIARCADIASPSRSGSPAKYTAVAVLADFLKSLITLPLPEIICSVGSKILASSRVTGFLLTFSGAALLFLPLPFFFFFGSSSGKRIPIVFLGRSITCPMDAFTVKSRPHYLLIFFALAGDSTITNQRAILSL